MCGRILLREGELIFLQSKQRPFSLSSRPLGGRHAAVVPALPEEYDASMPIGAYYSKREASGGVPRGLSHYPQHIIAQAEAQKSQQLATQQAKESASAGSSSSSPQRHEGNTLVQNTTQGNHALPAASSSKGLNIEYYQPSQQAPVQSQSPQKRATRSSTNINTSSSSASARSTRASTRGSRRQQEQQREDSVSAPGTSTSTSEAVPTTFAGIMSQFPVPSLTGIAQPGSS